MWKIDRFSRDKYDSVCYKSKLNKNGVSVISATEPIDNSPEGKLMESIFEGFSEYYIKDLEMKTSRGMTENTLKGKFNGGNITYGYYIDEDKHFQIDENTAPIVKDIFNRYANGETIKSIIEEMNKKGIKNRNKPFTYHFIHWMINNRRYLGEYSFRDTMNTEAIPAIISEEIFEKCQKRLQQNKKMPAKFKENYRYYQCMNSKKKKCDKKIIQKALIEKTVLDMTLEIFKDSELIKKISERCYSMQSTESSQVPILKKQLKTVQKEIDNVMNAIKAGIITKSTKDTLTKLEEEQENIQISLARERIIHPILSREQIEFWLMQFATTDITNEEQKQRLIDIFINSVYVYDDRLVVFLNYKDGERCITFDEVECIKKENTHIECSSFVTVGDPYGN